VGVVVLWVTARVYLASMRARTDVDVKARRAEQAARAVVVVPFVRASHRNLVVLSDSVHPWHGRRRRRAGAMSKAS
jgi:hypothetical protein